MSSFGASSTRTGTRSSSNKRPILPSSGNPDVSTSCESQQQQIKKVHRTPSPSPPLKASSKRAKLNDYSHSHVKHSHPGPSPGKNQGPHVVNTSERSVMNVIDVISSSNMNMNGNFSHALVGFVDSNGNAMSSRASEPSDLSSSGTNSVSRSSLKKELSNSSTVTSMSTSTTKSSSSASDISSTTKIAPASTINDDTKSQSGKSNSNGTAEAIIGGSNPQNSKSENKNHSAVPAPVRSSSQGHPNSNLAAYSHTQPQPPARCLPNTIRIVQVGERHWMCDICRAAVFENFVEACMHEMSCKQRTCAAPGTSIATSVTAAPVSGALGGTTSSNLPFPSYPSAPMQIPPHFQVPAMFQPLQSMQFGYAQVAAAAAAGRGQSLMHPIMQQPSSVAGSGAPMPIGYPTAASDKSSSAGGNDMAAPGAHTLPKSEALNVSLVPEKKSMLSDYNYILSKNIEFFETITTYTGINADSLPASKVGLRCIHCASGQRRITAASFFPSSKASISSGIGTIGSRHFIGGKCPFLPKDTLDALRASKKTSQQQTRTAGRIGLDAYCRELAKTHKIFDHEVGGIYFAGSIATTNAVGISTSSSDVPEDTIMSDIGKKLDSSTTKGSAKPTSTTNKSDCSKTLSSSATNNSTSKKIAPVLMVTRGGGKSSAALKTAANGSKPPAAIIKEEMFDRKDPKAFIESDLENFWECKHCKSLPFQWRASGSVVFCADTPSIELVGKHLSICQAKKPLRIPRNATVRLKKPKKENQVQAETSSINESSGRVGDTTMSSITPSQSCAPTVIVTWDTDEGKRKSGRIQEAKISKKKRSKPVVPVSTDATSANTNLPLKVGVENESLAVPEDKSLTTDFAYFTVLQMKKCYLAKAGGSRGNCPVGYPGLACAYCTGSTGERRFFYTSADHLRNSFSHIPSHLLSCSKCPADVKEKIEAYKALRSKQKSQLKGGDHKLFIDKVWARLHGPGGGVIAASSPEESYEASDNYGNDDDDRSMKSIEVDFNYEPDEYVTQSLDGRYLENKKISIETHQSPILTNSERKLVTDYVYYSILQMVPKQYIVDSDGTLIEMHEKGKSSTALSTSAIEKESVTAANKLPDTKNVEDSSKIDQVTRNISCTAATSNITGNKQNDAINIKVENTVTPTISNVTTSSAGVASGIVDERSILQDKSNSQGEKIQREKATNEIKQIEAIEKDEGEDDEDEEEQEEDEVLQTLVCKHCMNEDMDAEFLPESAEDLRLSFAEIPKHLMSCTKCPVDVKNKLETVKAFRAVQEAMLKRGSHKKFVNKVWKKVDNYFTYENGNLTEEPLSLSLDKMNNAEFTSEVLATTLLSENDQRLVSEFTFFTMKQMEPCVLENSGNGARSMFSFGFPGLGCRHCSGKPSARKFFYRTPDILSGNYAHIPNHVMVCKYAPVEIKQTLAAKKKLHAEQKQKLQRGSQRTFFSNVWTRLHVRKSIREGKI